MLKYSDIPSDYLDLDFENFEHNIIKSKVSLEKAKEYSLQCKDEKFHDISLYLYGENSSGKSTIACAIGKEFIRQGLIVKFVQAGVLTNIFMKNMSYSVDLQTQNKLNMFEGCDLIIVDDAFDKNKSLTWKNSNDIIVQAWDSFFRSSLANDIRFIITSNVELESIYDTYSPSLFELFDRNFYQLKFEDDIKTIKKNRFEKLFQDVVKSH